MLTIENKSRMSLDQVARRVVDSFGVHGTIHKVSGDTLEVEHKTYSGKYVFTGELFAKV